MKNKILIVMIICYISCSLMGCGQTGKLYLPTQKTPSEAPHHATN